MVTFMTETVKKATINATDYDHDFYAWAFEQAARLRNGCWTELDVENIAEELESLGRSEKRELRSRLSVLLTHLLKWQYQPGLRSKSWEITIEIQRQDTVDHLDENPSLKAQLDETVNRAYQRAVLDACKQTGLVKSAFPAQCPYKLDDILRIDYLPSEK